MSEATKDFWKKIMQAVIVLVVIAIAVGMAFGVAHFFSRSASASYAQVDISNAQQIRRIVRDEFGAHQTNLQILLVFAAAGIGFFGIFVPMYVQKQKNEEQRREQEERDKKFETHAEEFRKKAETLRKEIYTQRNEAKSHKNILAQLEAIQKEHANEIQRTKGEDVRQKKVEAIKGILKLKVEDDDSIDPATYCGDLMKIGKNRYVVGDYFGAIKSYYQYIEQCPHETTCACFENCVCGTVCACANSCTCEKRKEKTHHADAYSNIAKAYWRLDDYHNSLIAAEKAKQLAPNSARSYYLCGVAHRDLHNFPASIKYITEAIQMESREERKALYHAGLAAVYGAQGNFKKARDEDHTAIELCQNKLNELPEKLDKEKEELIITLRKLFKSHALTHEYWATIETDNKVAGIHRDIASANLRTSDGSIEQLRTPHETAITPQ